MTSILQRIAEHKAGEVSLAKRNRPLSSLLAEAVEKPRDFIAALRTTDKPAIIAEIKKASPSKGLIRADFNVADIATIYAEMVHVVCLFLLIRIFSRDILII